MNRLSAAATVLLCGTLTFCLSGCGDNSAAARDASSESSHAAVQPTTFLTVDDLSAQLTAQLRDQHVLGLPGGEAKGYGRVERVQISRFEPPRDNEALRVYLDVILATNGKDDSPRSLSTSTALYRATDHHLVGNWSYKNGPPLTFVLTFREH